ncbi:MAG: hypothetical protein Q8K78_04395, partial [Planctomycetaceae bacterium]|nr:hypothetical protein [Planctomycetaceae bacterium]
WDGWDDALYYWDRLKQSGHEADAVRVLLETRDAPGSLVYGQALYVLSTKMVESHREVVAELSRELQNPSLSERKKNDIRATLETIQKGLAENFPQEIEPVK